MRVGGVRRVAVRPERGWKKQDPKCATEIDMGVMSGVPGAALAKVSQGARGQHRAMQGRLPPFSFALCLNKLWGNWFGGGVGGGGEGWRDSFRGEVWRRRR